jgi:transposase
LLAGIEAVSERICEYNERIEQLAQKSYPQSALLKQVKGVGTLIALTYMLTLEDPHRFQNSRDVHKIPQRRSRRLPLALSCTNNIWRGPSTKRFALTRRLPALQAISLKIPSRVKSGI